MLRVTFHNRTSSIEPVGENCQLTSLPIRIALPLVPSAPTSGNDAASSPLM